MPLHYNDALDDTLTFDGQMSFVGGQVSNVRSSLIGETQYAEGINIDIDRFGSAVTRRGTKVEQGRIEGVDDPKWQNASNKWHLHGTIWNATTGTVRGLDYYDTTNTEELLACVDGKLWKTTGGAWSEVSGYTPNSDERVEMTQLVDRMFFTDGVNNVHSYDGSTITDEGTGSGNPPICKYLVNHTNRLFAAGTSTPDALLCSALLDGQDWDIVNDQIRIGAGNDKITGLQPWDGFNLLVFLERSIFNVVTTPTETTAANWSVENVDRNVGCVSGRTIAQVGSDVFFLARDGIRTVRGILEGARSAVSEPISVGINDVIETINWEAAVDVACAGFFNNHYWLSVPTYSSSVPDTCIVFNTISKSFVGKWTGMTPTKFATSAFNGYPKMIFGQTDGKVLTWQDYVAEASESVETFQDDGVNYASSITTRAFNWGDQFSEKQPEHVEFEFKPGLSDRVEVRVKIDSVDERAVHGSIIDTGSTSVVLPVVLPVAFPSERPMRRHYNMMTHGPCNEAEFIAKTTAKKMEVRSVKAAAYLNTMALEKT